VTVGLDLEDDGTEPFQNRGGRHGRRVAGLRLATPQGRQPPAAPQTLGDERAEPPLLPEHPGEEADRAARGPTIAAALHQ
jgi:hypothetical protein